MSAEDRPESGGISHASTSHDHCVVNRMGFGNMCRHAVLVSEPGYPGQLSPKSPSPRSSRVSVDRARIVQVMIKRCRSDSVTALGDLSASPRSVDRIQRVDATRAVRRTSVPSRPVKQALSHIPPRHGLCIPSIGR